MALRALRVRGPYRGPSGYDHHTREFVRAFHRRGVAIELVDLPEWGPVELPRHLRDPWFATLRRPLRTDVTLQFCMPHQVQPYAGVLNANYTMFEATRIPEHWAAAGREIDLTVLPTESSQRAWLAGGVPAERLRLCPLGVDAALYGRPAEPLPLVDDAGAPLSRHRVRFLNVSALGPRKNLVGLFRAWIKATSPADDAVLIVKLGHYAPGASKLFWTQVGHAERELGRYLSDAAPVHLVYDLLADAEMPRLYAAATHYVSLSFGEAWDQAMAEAAAAGLKLIVPDHSAYPAYLDPSVARLIPSREVPAVFPDAGSGLTELFGGANWWEPDEAAAVAAIRDAIGGRGAPGSARSRMLSEFTWDRAAARLLAMLDEAAAARRRRWFGLLPPSNRRA